MWRKGGREREQEGEWRKEVSQILAKVFQSDASKWALRKARCKDCAETLSGYQYEDEGYMEEKDKKVIICYEIKFIYIQNFLRIHVNSVHRRDGVTMQIRWCLLDILRRTDGVA